MIVIEKNEGAKVAYTQSGTVVSFADGRLALDCALYQKDWSVHLDVCENADGNLVIGTESGRKYVAQLDIPAREYLYPETAAETTTDPDNEETEYKRTEPPTPLPLDILKIFGGRTEDGVTEGWFVLRREPPKQ